MTCRAGLLYFYEQRVLVAVVKNFFHALDMARCLPLLPELLARTAPEPGKPAFNGPLQGLGVHISDHQNLAILPVLDNRWDQAFFIILEVVRDLHMAFLS